MKLLHEELDSYILDIQKCIKDIHPGLSLTKKKNAIFQITSLLLLLYVNNPLLDKESKEYRFDYQI